MDERTKEIRRILRGQFTYENDGQLILATQNPLKIQSDGMFFGIDGIRVLGAGIHERTYAVRGEPQATQDACVMNMLLRGPQVILRSSPNTLAVLHYPITADPSVLTLDAIGNQYVFCVYAARSLFAGRRAGRIFEKWEHDTAEFLRWDMSESAAPGAGAHAAGRKSKKKDVFSAAAEQAAAAAEPMEKPTEQETDD